MQIELASTDLMIPPEKLSAVTLGLQQAFHISTFEDICDLTERPGSNRAFRIVVRGSAYLLRINTRAGDIVRHFACMQTAADAGLAPRVYYVDAEHRISITDFVVNTFFPAKDALRRVPQLLRLLHALPPFPAATFNTTSTFLLTKGPVADGFLQRLQGTSLFAQSELDELFVHFNQLVDTYSSLVPDLVPSHNDLFKPDNILFDGSRVWLVDWEAAFQNDRYADIAVVANMLASDEDEERILLEEYFDTPANEVQVARLYLMRQLAHMFYGVAFLSTERELPDIRYGEFQRRFWSRDVGLTDESSKALYSKLHLLELMQNLRQPKFQEALRIVSQDHLVQD
jgi:hypothetical protein